MCSTLPEGWRILPLGEAATLQRGFDLPLDSRRAGDVPVYGSNGIDGWHDRAMVEGPGVITGRSGSIGFVHYEHRDFWPLNTTLYVRDFHGNNTMFIVRLLESINLQRFSASTGVPSLNRNFVHPTPVLVPPVDEQERITVVIDAADEASAKTEALIAKLKAVKQGLLHVLLTRGLDDNGEPRDPETHREHFKDSPLGLIPKEWSIGGIDDLAENHDGRRVPLRQSDRDKRNGIYPYYGASGVIDWIDDYLFDGDFVLLGEDGANVLTREIPLAFRATGKIWVNNHAHVLTPRDGIDIRFLVELLERTDYASIVIGSAQPKLTQNGLRRLRFLIPQSHEQEAIGDVLEAYSHRVCAEETYLSKLKAIKSGLMQDLLTGRVRVPKGLDIR
jgi:type I restriction enzyme S subunit